jgi:hypothetical protein
VTEAKVTSAEFATWLQDRRNARVIPHRFEEVGYVAVRNPDDKTDGRWRIGNKRYTLYAKKTLSKRDQFIKARQFIETARDTWRT